MAQNRWYRSERGQVFGVVAGLAEWRHLNVDTLRFIVMLIILFSGILPGLLVYLALAIILPLEGSDRTRGSHKRYQSDVEDAKFEDVK